MFVKLSFSKLVGCIITFIIGILCIIANQSSKQGDYENISTFLGVVIMISSILSLTFDILIYILAKKRLTTVDTLSQAFLLALGLFFICDKMVAADLIRLLLNYIPYAFVVLGSLLLLDSIVTCIRSKNDGMLKTVYPYLIAESLTALVTIILGAIALDSSTALAQNKFLIFGIMLVIYSSAMILLIIFMPSIRVKVGQDNFERYNGTYKEKDLEEVEVVDTKGE